MDRFVLYWMRVNRRVDSNAALEEAARRANDLGLPLVCLEELDCACPWANDRFHTFVLQGVPETARCLAARGIGYVFHLRRRRTDPDNIPARLGARLVVTDAHPLLGEPPGLGVPVHAVDASCVVPFRRLVKREYAAYSLRPKRASCCRNTWRR